MRPVGPSTSGRNLSSWSETIRQAWRATGSAPSDRQWHSVRRSIVVASVSNQLFKLGIVGWMGGGRLLRIAGIFFGVKLVAAGLVLALWPAAAPA